MASPTYLFLDESGNFDFSVNGTRYFILTSVCIQRPFPWVSSLDSFKYDCLENGLDIERFHCTTDKWWVRNKVFDIIGNCLSLLRIDSLIVEKPKTGCALQKDIRFYPEMMGYLLKYVLKYEKSDVIIISDRIPMKRKRSAIEKGVQNALATGLQVADYCCWAIYQKWARGDMTCYNRIRGAMRSEFDIFRLGTTYHYGHELWAKK
ncbi:MAG: DUF3800 domain-containing protein [Chloroflexi bacterium]|nr:DUF3800 domain-containing protein [Chloroflexota bacterium]